MQMEANTQVNGVTIKEMAKGHSHGLTIRNTKVFSEMI